MFGLDTQYGSAKNQLLSGSELPPLNVALSQLSRIPVQMENTTKEDLMALAAAKPSSLPTRGRGRGGGAGHGGGADRDGGRSFVKSEDRYCDFCNVAGHMLAKAW